mgnify:CR=1 FL=1
MKNICIIPARKNSKRIKNKNIKNFCGKPLIYYSINLAKKSKLFDRIIVTTDSPKIKKIAIKYGAEVPFLRSKILSNDFTSTKKVLKDVVDKINLKKEVNIFCIYCTAPLIIVKDLKNALKSFKLSNSEALYAITKYSHSPLRSLKKLGNFIFPNSLKNMKKRSQDLQSLFHDSGTFYIFKSNYLKKKKNFFSKKTSGYLIPKYRAIDIDEIEDFKLAEYIKKKNL